MYTAACINTDIENNFYLFAQVIITSNHFNNHW